MPSDNGTLIEESCCQCTQATQCQCDPENCDCKLMTNKEYYSNKIDHEVAQWLSTIPVKDNEHLVDKKRREEMVKDLAEIIKELPDNADFENNARDAIKKCVDEMPMWYPGAKNDEEQMKRQIVKDLLYSILRIPRKPNKLRDTVKNFINSLNFIYDVDKNVITDNFVNNLKYFAVNVHADDKIFKKMLIYEIAEMIEDLPILYRGNKTVILNKLSQKLADDVKELLKQVDLLFADKSLGERFKEIISKWFDDVIEVTENIPNSEEIKKYIDDLVLVLQKIQSQGINEMTLNKMENCISNVLENLNLPMQVINELTHDLIDKVTDVIYAKAKDKLDTIQKQETFKEIQTWLKDIQNEDKLSQNEEYILVKQIAEKIQASIDDTNKDYKKDILEILSKLDLDFCLDTISTDLDEIKIKLQLLPEKINRYDLLSDFQEDFYNAIDGSNLSIDIKNILKDKVGNIIIKNLEGSSLSTKRDIDIMKEIVLEQIYDIIEHIPDTVQIELKRKFVDSLEKFVNKIYSAKEKAAARYTLLKEINYLMEKEPIPDDVKNYIKYNIKHIINENLDQPFSDQIKRNILGCIGKQIRDSHLERNQKDKLIKKLTIIVVKILDQLPKESMKDHVKHSTIIDINKVIDQSEISEVAKENMKQKLKRMFYVNFDQPFSADIKNVILQDINNIIDDLVIPKALKNKFKRQLGHATVKNLDVLPDQTAIDYIKESLIDNINDFLDNTISVPRYRLRDLKNQLELTFINFLDQPYTRDQRNKLNETLDNIITKLDIPFDKKDVILKKLLNIIDKKLAQLPYQTSGKYVKDTIMRNIAFMLNDLSLLTDEKEELIKQLDALIDENLQIGYLSEVRDVIKKGIVNIIRKSSASQQKQDDFIFKTLRAVSQTFDEAYYEDYEREQLQELYDMLDKAPLDTAEKNLLKAKTKRILDDHRLHPEFGNVRDMLKEAINLIEKPSDSSLTGLVEPTVDKTITKAILNAVKTARLPKNEKTILEKKVNVLVSKLNTLNDLDKTVKELENIFDEIPMSTLEKNILKSKLAIIVSKDPDELYNQFKNALVKKIESAVDLITLDKEKDSNLKSKINNIVFSLDEPITDNTKDKIKEDIFRILDKDVYSNDKKNECKDRISRIIDKLPTQIQDENIISKALVKNISDIIDEMAIHQHIKHNIKLDIKDIISHNLKQPLSNDMIERIKADICNIIRQAPITEYQKQTLSHKISKELDQLHYPSAVKSTIFSLINSILDDEALPETKKSELMKKIQQHLTGFDESAPSDVKNKKMKAVLKAIDETVMPKDKKRCLKDKLENVLRKTDKSSKDAQADSNVLISPNNGAFQELGDNLSEEIVKLPRITTERYLLRDNIRQNIDNLLNEIPVSTDQRRELKFKLQDLFDLLLEKPVASNTLKEMDKELRNIISGVPVSKEKKIIIQNKLASMVEDCIKTLYLPKKNQQIADAKAALIDEINSTIDQLKVDTYQKENLKQNLQDIIEENLSKSLDNETIQMIKDNINDVISEAPIPGYKKADINTKLSEIVDNKLIHSSRQLGANFIKDSGKEVMLPAKKDKAPIINTQEMIAKRDENKKEKVIKKAVTDGITSILDQLEIKSHQKDELKHKFKGILDKNFEKPINDDTVRALKDNIDNIISVAPIPKAKKAEIRDKIYEIIDNKLESLPDDIISVDKQQPITKLNGSKRKPGKVRSLPQEKIIRTMDEIDSVVGQLQIPNELKSILKEKLIEKAEEALKTSRKSLPQKSKKDKRTKSTDIKSNNIKSGIKDGMDSIYDREAMSLDSKHIKSKYEPASKIMSTVTEDIDSIVDQLEINNYQKATLKQQLEDSICSHSVKGMNSDTLNMMKNDINNIVSKAPIATDKKKEVIKKMIHMIDNKVKYPLDQKDNSSVLPVKKNKDEIDSIIGRLKLPPELETVLKHKLNNILDENVENPFDENINKKNELNDLMFQAQIPKKTKVATEKKIVDMLDGEAKSIDNKGIKSKYIPASNIKSSLLKDIECIVDQLEINNYEKAKLRQQLVHVIESHFVKPVNSETLSQMKDNINNVISEAPIAIDKKNKIIKKIFHLIDNKVTYPQDDDSIVLPVKKNKLKVDSIIGRLKLPTELETVLKQKLNNIVDENVENLIDDSINKKNKVGDHMFQAPIPKKTKVATGKEKVNILDSAAKSTKSNGIESKYELVSKIKNAIIEDIDSIVDQLEINNSQKAELKRQLNIVVNENEEIDGDAMQYIKNKMNNIISEAPMQNEKKHDIKKKLSVMINNLVESMPSKSVGPKYKTISEIREGVTEGIASIVDQLEIDNYQKAKLKNQLNDMVDEAVKTPINDDSMKYIKNKIYDIISKVPIPKQKKSLIRRQISNMVDSNVRYIPSESIAPKFKPVIEVKKATSDGIDTIVDQLEINDYQKNNLKQQLNDIVNDILVKPVDSKTRQHVKKRIDDIISEASLPKDIIKDTKKKIIDMVDYKIKDLRDYERQTVLPQVKGKTLTQNIDSAIGKIQLPHEQKTVLIQEIKDKVNENLKKPFTAKTLNQTKEDINHIIDVASISKQKKAEIRKEISNIIENYFASPTATESITKGNGPQREEKYNVNKMMLEIDSDLDKLGLTTHEKNKIRHNLKNMVTLDSQYPGFNIKDGIHAIITQAPIPSNKKAEIIDKLSSVVQRKTKPETVIIKDEALRNINNMLQTSQIPSDEKEVILTTINDMMSRYTEMPIPVDVLNRIKVDINNIIAEIDMLDAEKEKLKDKITKELNANTDYIISGKDYSRRSYNKTNISVLRFENPGTSSSRQRSNTQPQQQKSSSGRVIYDADDEDTKDEISFRIPTKKIDMDEDLLRHMSKAIDELDISSAEKLLLKQRLTVESESQEEEEEHSSEESNEEDSVAKKVIRENISGILNELAMPKQGKSDLRGQVTQALNRKDDSDLVSGHKSMLSKTGSFITKLPVAKHVKDRFMAKLVEMGHEPVTSSPVTKDSVSRPRSSNRSSSSSNQIPVTSTPKRPRKVWASSRTLSPISVDHITNPEVRDYWNDIEECIFNWLDALHIDLDGETKNTIKEAIGKDIRDREKYLSMNPSLKKSIGEELEDLQYQMFRRLNKVLNEDDMKVVREAASDLMKSMNAANVPKSLMISAISEDSDGEYSSLDKITDTVGTARPRKASMTYKQQLEDVVSTTLPIEDASSEVLDSFEIIKGNVADAFISLHYSGGDEEQRKKLKKKIYDQVDKFCDNYLKKYPNKPINREKLAEDLYAALKKVPPPSDESMKLEEELIRLKAIVNDWLNSLPLKALTDAERLQVTNKVATLAKNLKYMEENDSLLEPIVNFLSETPLQPGQETNINSFAKKLVTRIRTTEAARRVDDSIKYHISPDDTLISSQSIDTEGICPYFKSMLERQKQLAEMHSHPPCSLSEEDIEHLERIRQRTCMTHDCLSSLLRSSKRNTYIDPMAAESSSQTEQSLPDVRQRVPIQPCPSTDRNRPRPCPGITKQFAHSKFVDSGSQIEIQPQIIIKEYYWDTVDSTEMPPRGSRHSTGSIRCRRTTAPYAQVEPCPGFKSHVSARNPKHQTYRDRRSGPSLPFTSSPYNPRLCTSRPSLPFTASPCGPRPACARPCSPSPCTSRSSTPRLGQVQMSQILIPPSQATPKNSYEPFPREYEYGRKRNGLQPEYPEYFSYRYPRRERVIELGSLDNLRKPYGSGQARWQDDNEWMSHFPEDEFWRTTESRDPKDDEDESEFSSHMPYIREQKEERVRCKCKEKLLMSNIGRRPRQHCVKHSNIWLGCTDNNSLRRCSRCFGSHCPHPSYMYFK